MNTRRKAKTRRRPAPRRKPADVRIEVAVQCPFPTRLRAEVRQAVQATFRHLPQTRWDWVPARSIISVAIVSPSEIQKWNRRYRKKDRPTDVLSFSLLDAPKAPSPAGVRVEIGQVLVCWKVAQSQAAAAKKPAAAELRMLVVHGVLHVFGYDHERSPRDERIMLGLQNRILKV